MTTLREKVAPILANNLLPHFTDHSVTHSDSVTQLVDRVLESLSLANSSLSDQELMILYSACYLHDIGMQFECAGETDVIRELNLIPPWEQRSDQDRRGLLRDLHNQISAEMVTKSVSSSSPLIGFQLTSEFNAPYVARLCHAHCISTDTPEYAVLVDDGPNIRMAFLSGILRISDILDESRRRASREKARTLMLDVESQTHWWRHYYTEDITFDPSEKTVTVWFDFPPNRRDEYERVVPLLQMPWITAEFNRHSAVFTKAGLGWTVRQESRTQPYSATEEMPECVLTAMLKHLASLRRASDEEHRLLALGQFKESRPSIERRLDAVRKRRPSISPREYLLEMSQIAFDLWDLGGRTGARLALGSLFLNDMQHLGADERIRIGIELLKMLVDEKQAFEAGKIVERLSPDVNVLEASDPRKWQFMKQRIRALAALCDIDTLRDALRDALQWAPSDQHGLLQAELSEIEMLHGGFSTLDAG